MRVGIIGTGMVATSFAIAIKKHINWLKIIGIYDINRDVLSNVAKLLNVKMLPPEEIVKTGDAVFFGTPDDEIEKAYKSIEHFIKKDQYLFHFSGVHRADVLKKGLYASIHPIFSFTKIVKNFEGIYFGIEGKEKAVELSKKILRGLGAKWIKINPSYKTFYHLMCVFASNMIQGMLYVAERMGKTAGIKNPLEITEKLTQESLKNAIREGPQKALTGPVKRGDKRTIEMHRKALKNTPPILELYDLLCELLIQMKKEVP